MKIISFCLLKSLNSFATSFVMGWLIKKKQKKTCTKAAAAAAMKHVKTIWVLKNTSLQVQNSF